MTPQENIEATKLSEFRIGNIIAEPEDKPGYFAIEEIKKNPQGKLSVYYRNGSIHTTDPSPIVLTEEWLLKLGCEKELDSVYADDFPIIYKDKNGQFIITKNKDGEWTYWSEGLWNTCIDLGQAPPIHRIQNIYFALNEKELELKQG